MKPISIAEPVTDLRRVPIHDNGERLVDFLKIPGITQGSARFNYQRETLVREGVAARLAEAVASLPKGYRIAVIEGWRAPHIQRRLYAASWNRVKALYPDWSDVRLKRLVNQFTAPMNPRVPPPHSTGAAMDVELIDADGNPYDVVSPYTRRDLKCYPLDAPGLTELARHNRNILSSALIRAGITNYPSEFWHYSYGDQGWAYRGGHPNAVYGPITPDGWTPNPQEDIEAPLEFKNPS